MKTLMYTLSQVGSASPQSISIHTTLYDLIAAVAAEVRPGEEALVTATARHLLRSHKARFIGRRVRSQPWCGKANYLNSASA
jgi:hypothetical protein